MNPPRQELCQSKKPSPRKLLLWVSISRLTAVLLIFIFHFNSLFNLPTHSLGTYGLCILLFIAGYLHKRCKTYTVRWLVYRYLRIMIPFWSIFIVVIIANIVTRFKPILFPDWFLESIGLGLYARHELYSLSYFLTILLLFSLSMYSFKFLSRKITILVFFILWYLALVKGIHLSKAFFISFYSGVFIQYIPTTFLLNKIKSRTNGISTFINSAQNYSYSFLLIHGIVLSFLVHFVHLDKTTTFAIALLLAMTASIPHHIFSQFIFQKTIHTLQKF